MTAPDLLPCPFCGGEAETDHRQPFWHYATGKTGYQTAVYCHDCVVNLTLCHDDHPGADPDDLMAELVAAWNRRTPSSEVAALIAEARREDAKLLLDAYKGVLVLMRMLDKAGLVAGASAADQISKRIVDAHPEFPGMASLRALKETTHD